MNERALDSPEFKLALDHSWAWFSLHAGQRMQLVNFWLISMAFLASALVSASVAHRAPLTLVIALCGLFATVGFHRLESRTRALVKVGEAALRHLQQDLAKATGVHELEMLAAADGRPRVMGSHGTVIRFLHGFAALAFAGTAAEAAARWGGWI